MNDVPQEVIDELWRRGALEYKLHKAQLVLDETYIKSPGQLFVGNCSRQWGKSFWAVTKAIETALKIPKAQIRYGAAFQTDVVDFIIPAFEKICEDAPDDCAPRKVGNSYVFPNGSRIKIVGLDKRPNGLRGNTLDLIIIDECGFVAKLDYLYKSVIVPATLHRPNCKIIFISTPPATPAHPFKDYALKAQVEGCYAEFDIYSNPLVTPDDIDRMEKESGGKDTTTFKREYLCKFVTDSDSQIIPEWKDEFVQDIERDQFYPYYHKYVGMDLGIKDFTALIFGYYDFKRASLVIEDELTMNGPSMNTELLVQAVRAKEAQLWNNKELPRDTNHNPVPFRRVSDTTWPILIQDLSTLHNLTFIETSKDLLEAMINEVRLMVQKGQILVHPRCVQLLGCLTYGIWDEKKKAFARMSAFGHFDHLAALVYLVRNLAKHTNPIPAHHGYENHTAWLGNIKDKMAASHNARTIQQALIRKPPSVSTLGKKRGVRS